MNRRPLGRRGLEITPVGIGTAPIGSSPGRRWVEGGRQDERDSIRAIHAALDGGATRIDTARRRALAVGPCGIGVLVWSPLASGAPARTATAAARPARSGSSCDPAVTGAIVGIRNEREGARPRIPRMTDVLIHADTVRSPAMRHEVPLTVPDPFLYVEHGGRRTVVVTAFERDRIGEAAPDIDALPPEQFGWDELIRGGTPPEEAALQMYTRAVRELGVTEAAVPARFPVELADHLRANGIAIAVERDLFEDRRRSKNATEVAGLRRAQRACEAALDVARAMLREADHDGGPLRLGGEPLTSERIKAEMDRVFLAHGTVADEYIVAAGAQAAVGHDMGRGPISAGESIVFDLWPRDRETAVYTDMTRTYVVGDVPDELREYHRLCKEALERTTEAVKPGVNGRALMQIACDVFAAAGHPTQLTKRPGEVLSSGFFHGLGHGVGLEVHERPRLSVVGDDLVPGDVITLEPGLYRAGYGGVRLEDILLVTEDGAETVTRYPYDLEP